MSFGAVKGSIVGEKSLAFAIRIVRLYSLLKQRKEFIMSKQLMRSGTSIGANVREALNGQSRADFIHKLSIAQKECDESIYWLILLKESKLLKDNEYASIRNNADELLKIIRSIILTVKETHNS
jgi:four helix bundle protein